MGATGTGTDSIAYSYNGINWTGIGNTIFSNAAFAVAWNGNIWVAVGYGTNTNIGDNMINWKPLF